MMLEGWRKVRWRGMGGWMKVRWERGLWETLMEEKEWLEIEWGRTQGILILCITCVNLLGIG